MLANIRYWEEKAKAGHYAVPHFNVQNAKEAAEFADASGCGCLAVSVGTTHMMRPLKDEKEAVKHKMRQLGFQGGSLWHIRQMKPVCRISDIL